jgi:hypothetical protein
MPALALTSTGPQWVRLPRRVVGADAGWTINEQFTLRTEFSASRTGAAGQAMADAAGVGNARWWVLSVEHPLPGGWLLSTALSLRRSDVRSADTYPVPELVVLNRNRWFQSGPRDDAWVLSATKSPFEDDWSGEAALVSDQSRSSSGALLLRAAYRIDDAQTVRAVVQVYRGPADTSLGALRRNNLALLEWQWAFGR